MANKATPEEMLAAALDDVERAEARLAQRRRAEEDARQRATEVSGLTVAAQHVFENADAKYRVFSANAPSTAGAKDLRSGHSELEARLAAATESLSQAQDLEKSVNRFHASLEEVTAAVRRLVSGAEAAVTALTELEADLDAAASAAPQGHKAQLRNAARSLRRRRATLAREHDALLRQFDIIRRDSEAAPAVARPDALRRKVDRLKSELDRTAQHQGRHPVVSAADLEQARAERDNAGLALSAAPDIERTAQTNLRARQAEVAEAEAGYAAAMAALDQAESKFIGGIELTAPDDQGLRVARVLFRQPLPQGYQVGWTVSAGRLAEPVGAEVHIDFRAVPPGSYTVSAHVERAQTTPS